MNRRRSRSASRTPKVDRSRRKRAFPTGDSTSGCYKRARQEDFLGNFALGSTAEDETVQNVNSFAVSATDFQISSVHKGGESHSRPQSSPKSVGSRSDAFGDLKKSVDANGERLVEKMREYERARSSSSQSISFDGSLTQSDKQYHSMDRNIYSESSMEVGGSGPHRRRSLSMDFGRSPFARGRDSSPRIGSPELLSDSEEGSIEIESSCPNSSPSRMSFALSDCFDGPDPFSRDSETASSGKAVTSSVKSRSEISMDDLRLALASGGDLADYTHSISEDEAIVDSEHLGELWD